jgi:hypothetical protein
VAQQGRPGALENVSVLAMVGSQDGDSSAVICKPGGYRSVVIPGAPHGIAARQGLREALVFFLRECGK